MAVSPTKRLAATTALLVATAVAAGPASAAITPTFSVGTTNVAGGANVILSGGTTNPAEDAPARIQLFVPRGFELRAPAGGASVGSATGRVLVKDVDPSTEENFTATITAIGTTDPAVSVENASCDNVTHAAAWMLRLTAPDGQASFPIFVDRTAGAEAQFGPYKLVLCLRSPDLPQGDPNRAANGTKLNFFQLKLSGFKVPTAAGAYRWRSLWTTYTPGTATLNTAGSVEAQSIVTAPGGSLTLSAAKVKTTVKGKLRTRVRLTGRLVAGGKGLGGTRVALSHGATKTKLVPLGSAKTNGSGAFVILSTLNRPTYFQAGATLQPRNLGAGGCTPSFGAGVRCVSATASGSQVLSRFLYAQP